MLLSTVSYKKEENPVSLKTKRIEFIDALKGIVIFLVVYTHCYECVKGVRFGDPEIMADNFYAFGLAFHMPLFMFLSGLFSKSLIANDLSYFFKRRILPILIPLIVWTGISSIWESSWCLNLNGEYWFLNCILIIYVIIFPLRYIPQKMINYILPLFCILAMCFGTFSMYHVNSMLPFFCAGFYVKQYYSTFERFSKQICIISGVTLFVLSFFWKTDYTCYIVPIDLFENSKRELIIILYRILIGLSASLFFFSLLYIFYDKIKELQVTRYLNIIGKNTLAIYLIHYFLYWIDVLPSVSSSNRLIDGLLITPLYCCAVIVVCNFLIRLIRKNKYVAFILIGDKLR